MFRIRTTCTALLLTSAVASGRVLAAEPDSGATAAASIAASRAHVGPLSLDGIWMFDAAHSDDPMKTMQSMRGGEGGGGRHFGGGGMGGGFGGGGGGRHWGGGGGGGGGGMDADDGGPPPAERDESAPRGPRPFERVMHPPKKVVIEMLADQVNVADDERQPRGYSIADSLKAHGRDLVTEGTSAQWKGGKLEMRQVMGRGGSLVETYELSRDGATLTIRAHRDGGREGMPNPTFTRVYTRYEGD
jgi:hypothetical protein